MEIDLVQSVLLRKQKDSFLWAVWKWVNWSWMIDSFVFFFNIAGFGHYVCHTGWWNNICAVYSFRRKWCTDWQFTHAHTSDEWTNKWCIQSISNVQCAHTHWLPYVWWEWIKMGGRVREREKCARYFVYCMNLGLQFEFMWRFMLLCIFVL